MRVFERLGTWLWTFGEGVQPSPPEITNDELVTAYEHLLAACVCDDANCGYAAYCIIDEEGPESVRTTLRKLGAR